MNRKHIAIIISLVLILISIMLISGCNKEDDSTTNSTTVTPETEITDEVTSTEDNTENDTITEVDKSEPATDDKDESTTEVESQPPVKVEDTTVEHTSDKNEPVTCDACGNIILNNENSGDITIGNYCDGHCDEWFNL